MSAEADGSMGRVPAPCADDSRAVPALLIALNVTAGCTDIIGFLVLNGLFTALSASQPAHASTRTRQMRSAMAMQNALEQISLKGAPSTAVMTSNVTRFAMDVGEVLLGGDSADVAKARNRAARTLPVIVGFTIGCGLGAACEAALGSWSLALPAGLALLAFAMGFAAEPDDGPHR